MQKFSLVAVLLLFSTLFVHAQNATLRGVVTQTSNKQPLPGANVYFSGTTLGTATNNKGEYRIKNLKPGSYELCFSFSGFHRIKKQVNLVPGENTISIEMEESKKNLGEIVVTGTGTAHHLATAPVPTELFSKKAVVSTGATEFTELMSNLSPSFDFAPGVMGSFITLNGLSNDFILILVDGKRLYGDVGGMNDLNRINPDNIERIEVLKGAASLLYGSDAIAGVVNIITKRSKQNIHVSNTSRIRDYSTFQQNNSVDLNLGRFSLQSTFSRKRSDGWQLSKFEKDDDELVETDAMGQNAYEDYTFSNRLGINITNQLSVYGGISVYEKDVFVPVSVKTYGYYYDDKAFEAGAKWLLKGRNFISFDYNYDKYRYYYRYNQEYKSYAKDEKSINNDQRMNNFRLKYVHKFSKNNKLTLGGDYLREKMVSENRLLDGEADANTTAFYAQEELTFFRNLDIVAGLRVVKHKEFGGAVTPKISALYKWNNINLRGTYGHGFKAPTVKELYYDYERRGTVYMGNTDLDPQKSRYYSSGIEFHNSFLTASVTAYINAVDGLITYETVDLLPGDKDKGIKKRRQHYNIDEAKTKGVDFMLNAKLGHGFTAGGGYSLVEAKDEISKERLDGVAKHYGNVRLAYDHSWKVYHLNANILGRMQDEKSYDNGEDNAKAYNIWKLTTNHRFTSLGAFVVELSAGIDNIFDFVDDSPYGSHYGTINPGRTFFMGLKVNFAK